MFPTEVRMIRTSSDSKLNSAIATIGNGADIVVSKEECLTQLSLFFAGVVFRTRGDIKVAFVDDEGRVFIEDHRNSDNVEVYLRNRWGMRQLW